MSYVNLVVEGDIIKRAFRRYVEGLASQLDISGIIYNDDNGFVVISCKGQEKDPDMMTFVEGVERFPRARVSHREESQEPYFPKDFSRVVQDYEKEIAERLDEGVTELRNIYRVLNDLDEGQKGMREDIGGMREDIGGMHGDIKGLRGDIGKYFDAQLEFNGRMTIAVETTAESLKKITELLPKAQQVQSSS